MKVGMLLLVFVVVGCGESPRLMDAGREDAFERIGPESETPRDLPTQVTPHGLSETIETIYNPVTDHFSLHLDDSRHTEVASGSSLWSATTCVWGDRLVAVWVDAALPTPTLLIRLYRSSEHDFWEAQGDPVRIDEADIGGELSVVAYDDRIVIAYPASEYASRLVSLELSAVANSTDVPPREQPWVRHSDFFFMDLPGLSLSGEADDLQLAWFDDERVLIAPIQFEDGYPVLGLADDWNRGATAYGLETTALPTGERLITYNDGSAQRYHHDFERSFYRIMDDTSPEMTGVDIH